MNFGKINFGSFDFGSFDFSNIPSNFSWIFPAALHWILLLGILIFGIFITFYVFGSLGLYTMSSRRGLKLSWVSWIPAFRWIVAGNIASDVIEQRDKKANLYGPVLALCIISTFLVDNILIFTNLEWIAIFNFVFFIIRLYVLYFSFAEIYRDYSKRWVAMLIFTITLPILPSIFLFAIRKNMPQTVSDFTVSEDRPSSSTIITPPPYESEKAKEENDSTKVETPDINFEDEKPIEVSVEEVLAVNEELKSKEEERAEQEKYETGQC